MGGPEFRSELLTDHEPGNAGVSPAPSKSPLSFLIPLRFMVSLLFPSELPTDLEPRIGPTKATEATKV